MCFKVCVYSIGAITEGFVFEQALRIPRLPQEAMIKMSGFRAKKAKVVYVCLSTGFTNKGN